MGADKAGVLMKRWKIVLLNNWRIKLAALLAATLIWLFIKHDIVSSGASAPNASAPARFPE